MTHHYSLVSLFFFFLMIRRPPRSTQSRSSAASDVYKRQYQRRVREKWRSSEMPQYGDDEYWDQRYAGSETPHFEWYASFLELEDKVTSSCKDQEARILIVGCGNSRFSQQMFDAGYKDITSIDISEVCIKNMTSVYSKHSPDLKWVKMDVRDMREFSDESFDFVFDKGTLDLSLIHISEPTRPY
eukprot:TRINITY_DN15400_c0_g1_i1.p1 TRINITY_DN15400_c0_g1~~TRINITY_DN15400_c0_g1_i1.p1  ORF type:complete len:185 (+),score=73.83 TRINITY_DN15400_c0_g1_i1:91-645(+)